MGGSGAHEYMAPSSAGEDEVALCDRCDYAANVEKARSRISQPEFPPEAPPEEVATPGIETIDGARRVPRDRPARDGEGDAGGRGGRNASCSRWCAATAGCTT